MGISCERDGSFNHEGRESTNSHFSTTQVMLLTTKIPLVLRFQLNEQEKVKAVRLSGTDSTVKGGLVAVQIIGDGFCL